MEPKLWYVYVDREYKYTEVCSDKLDKYAVMQKAMRKFKNKKTIQVFDKIQDPAKLR